MDPKTNVRASNMHINQHIYYLHHNVKIHFLKLDWDYGTQIAALLNHRMSHATAFSFFKIKGENVEHEYTTIEGKWLRMSRLEKQPYLKNSLHSEQSSLLDNTDLSSQIRDVKYRNKQELSTILQQENIWPPTEPSNQFNISLLYDIIAATEDKCYFSTIALITSIVKK